jgi:hypothetical protein
MALTSNLGEKSYQVRNTPFEIYLFFILQRALGI